MWDGRELEVSFGLYFLESACERKELKSVTVFFSFAKASGCSFPQISSLGETLSQCKAEPVISLGVSIKRKPLVS